MVEHLKAIVQRAIDLAISHAINFRGRGTRRPSQGIWPVILPHPGELDDRDTRWWRIFHAYAEGHQIPFPRGLGKIPPPLTFRNTVETVNPGVKGWKRPAEVVVTPIFCQV